jgi:hypothetical protein
VSRGPIRERIRFGLQKAMLVADDVLVDDDDLRPDAAAPSASLSDSPLPIKVVPTES